MTLPLCVCECMRARVSLTRIQIRDNIVVHDVPALKSLLRPFLATSLKSRTAVKGGGCAFEPGCDPFLLFLFLFQKPLRGSPSYRVKTFSSEQSLLTGLRFFFFFFFGAADSSFAKCPRFQRGFSRESSANQLIFFQSFP